MRDYKDLFSAATGLAILGTALMAYTVLGRPPHGFYEPMKWAVAFACSVAAYATLKLSAWLAPLSAALAILGATQPLSKLHRAQWLPLNWTTLAVLALSAALLARQRAATQPGAGAGEQKES